MLFPSKNYFKARDKHHVVWDTTHLFLSLVLRKSMSLVYMMLIAWFCGVHVTGFFYIMISIWTLLFVLMDFGLSPVLIRKITHYPHRTQLYLGNVLSIKAVLCLFSGVAIVILLKALSYPDITQKTMYLVIIGTTMESLAQTFYACLRAHYAPQYEAFGMDAANLIVLVLIALSIAYRLPFFYLIVAVLCGSIFNLLFSYASLRKVTNIDIRFRFSTAAGHFIKSAIPFFFASAFSRLLFANMLMLSFITSPQIASLFSIPSALVYGLYFIPVAITTSLYPVFCKYRSKQFRKRLRPLFEYALLLLLSIIFPIAVCFSLTPQIVIGIFGKNFAQASPIFAILILSTIPTFVNALIIILFNSQSLQKITMGLMAFSASVNLGLSFILAPYFGGQGIAYSIVISQSLFSVTAFTYIYLRLNHLLSMKMFKDVVRVMAATVATAIVGQIMYRYVPFYYGVPIVTSSLFAYITFWIMSFSISSKGFSLNRIFALGHLLRRSFSRNGNSFSVDPLT
jgi:O-antigen/teichoic acid export membrane protein